MIFSDLQQVPEKSNSGYLILSRFMEAVSTVVGLLLFLHYLATVINLGQFKGYQRHIETFKVTIEEHRNLMAILGLTMSMISKITLGKDR